MKTRTCLKYFTDDVLWKQCFTSNSLQANPIKLNFSNIFPLMRPLTQFQSKIRATNLPKKTKLSLTS